MYKKPLDKSLGKEWKLCNNGGFPCYGNGNYDFREIMITPATYNATKERIERLIDPITNDFDVREKFEIFKTYKYN
jgi:hypothetical protein